MPEVSSTPVSEEAQPPKAKKQTKFAIDLFKIVSGTVIAQVIGTVTSLVIARLFNPEAFGLVALLTSIIGIVVSVYTLEYELAIVLPKDDADAANLLVGVLGITVLITLLIVPVIWLGGTTIANWLNAPELASYLWLIPLFLLFGGTAAGHPVLTAWAGRVRHFREISTTQVIGTISSGFGKITAGLLGVNSAAGLLGGTLLGSILPTAMLGRHIWRQNHQLFLEKVTWQRILENLKRYQKFATYNTPAALLNTISWQVPTFFLSAFFSSSVVGYYAFSHQLLRIPMHLIGGSIAQVFHSHSSTAYHDGKLAEFVEATFRRLVEYSFFPILMLAVIGKELATVVFGAQWAEAGVYLQILSLWMIFWFISSPMSRLYVVLEKNQLVFFLNIVILITRVASIWLGGIMQSPRIALILFSISGAMVYGYLSISILVMAGVSWRSIGQILFQNLFLFSLAGVSVLVLKFLHVSDLAQVFMAALLVAFYFVYRLKDMITQRLMVENIIKTLLSKIKLGR